MIKAFCQLLLNSESYSVFKSPSIPLYKINKIPCPFLASIHVNDQIINPGIADLMIVFKIGQFRTFWGCLVFQHSAKSTPDNHKNLLFASQHCVCRLQRPFENRRKRILIYGILKFVFVDIYS